MCHFVSLFAGLAGDVVEVVVRIGETSSRDLIAKVFEFPPCNINPLFAQGLTKNTLNTFMLFRSQKRRSRSGSRDR